MKVLEIRWHKSLYNNSEGYMILNVDLFFPCKADKRKIFPLMWRWCSDEQIEELIFYLKERVNVLEKYMKICEENCMSLESNTVRKYKKEFNVTKREFDGLQRNLKWLERR